MCACLHCYASLSIELSLRTGGNFYAMGINTKPANSIVNEAYHCGRRKFEQANTEFHIMHWKMCLAKQAIAQFNDLFCCSER